MGSTTIVETFLRLPAESTAVSRSPRVVESFLRLCSRSGFSRVPVIGSDIDDLLGVAYLKDAVGVDPVPPHEPVDRRLALLELDLLQLLVVGQFGGAAVVLQIPHNRVDHAQADVCAGIQARRRPVP